MLSTVAGSSTAVDSYSHSINPDVISNSEVTKKRRKKRLRDEEQQADETLAERGGKKKRRKHDKEKSGGLACETPSTVVEPVQGATSVKKKKKKDKAKEKVVPLAQQTDAEIEANSQASAAALLSAIVATMSNSQGALPQMQPPIPYGSGHFLPFPPMSFGFPDGATHPNAFPNLAITPNGGPLSELALRSNDDILRALQEIDIGKLTAALKNVGGTGGDNGPAPPPPHLPFMPPVIASSEACQISMNDPNGPHAKKAFSKNGYKRTIDMSLPGGEQHINPNHAQILATKWLNASKLTELVREEGRISIDYQAVFD